MMRSGEMVLWDAHMERVAQPYREARRMQRRLSRANIALNTVMRQYAAAMRSAGVSAKQFAEQIEKARAADRERLRQLDRRRGREEFRR